MKDLTNSSAFNAHHSEIIRLFIKYKIITFSFKKGFTLKSGIQSPIYVDARKCLAYPDLMKHIDSTLGSLWHGRDWVVAGVATGGLPYAGRLQSKLGMPLCYVRPEGKTKNYGKKNLIEGAPVKGKTVFLIEDVATTGKSIERDALVFLKAGSRTIQAYSVFSYDSNKVRKNLSDAQLDVRVIFMSLITLQEMLPALQKKLKPNDYDSLLRWKENPEAWQP